MAADENMPFVSHLKSAGDKRASRDYMAGRRRLQPARQKLTPTRLQVTQQAEKRSHKRQYSGYGVYIFSDDDTYVLLQNWLEVWLFVAPVRKTSLPGTTLRRQGAESALYLALLVRSPSVCITSHPTLKFNFFTGPALASPSSPFI